MAYTRVRSLFVLTLLQLCRAEISDSLPESWYSANVISDGFQPKPISEIFTTESPFSSTNPIVVLPKQSSSVPDEILLLSTLPPKKIATTGSTAKDFAKTSVVVVQSSTPRPPTLQTIPPSSLQTIPPTTFQTTPSTVQSTQSSTFQSTPSTFQSTPSTFQSTPSSTFQSTPSTFPSKQSTFQSTPLTTFQSTPWTTFQSMPSTTFQSTPSTTFQSTPSSTFPSTPLTTFQSTPSTMFQSTPSTTFPPEPQPNFGLQSTVAQPQPPSSRSSQTQSQQIRLELVPRDQLTPSQYLPEQQVFTQQQQSLTSTLGPLSNYFVIYQQAPQSVQGYPGLVGSSQEVPQLSTVGQVPTTRTPSTVIIQPAPTVSPSSTRTAPPTSTTPFPSTVRLRTTPTARTTRACQNFTNIAPTQIPRLPAIGGSFPLRIRVVAPSGSITNVNFNTLGKTTTTRRPTTTRTRKQQKPKKNNYDACTDGCKGRREPICAAPLSTDFLDPNTLKGFPSVCHMACHNSYRKDPYEKVLDGRCGRLRTRIKTVDSNTKLKREELNKAQYFLDNSGTKTIVEVSGLN